jgi:hypothetical protein
VLWRLSETDVAPDIEVEQTQAQALAARDLAVLVSVTGDVEPAVRATPGLPKFRAIVSIRPPAATARCDLSQPGHASYVAHLVVRALRNARKVYPTVERTHLFIAAPVGVAVLIGQQLNALGPIHTYEHDQITSIGCYRPAVVLTDPQSGG